MNVTSIEWTTFSANPLKYRDAAGDVVWGCVHASPGCTNCYSEALAKRYDRGGPFNVPTMNGLTPFLGEAECHKMRTAKQIDGVPVSGSRCFVGDMTDIFGEWVSDELLNQLFSNVLEVRTDVTWQLLTKRAERMHRYLSWRWGEGRIPSRHIHIGVSVENQTRANERIPFLLQTPAALRFLSCEPLLAHLNIAQFIDVRYISVGGRQWIGAGGIGWIIVGCESGAGRRNQESYCDHARTILRQCASAGVPAFHKQMPISGRVSHDPTEWAGDLRVREFPVARL